MHARLRFGFALALWLLALWPVTLILLHADSPVAAARTQLAVQALAGQAGSAGLVLALVLALLYPPFVPGLRLHWHRLRRRLAVERTPLLEALTRLRSFETAHDHFVAGRTLLAIGEAPRALPHLLRAAELDPAHAATAMALGECLVAQRAWPQAAAVLQRVVAADEGHAYGDGLLRLGEALLRSREPAAARAVLERRVARFGPNREALHLLADACADLGDHAARTQALRQASVPLDPAERRNPGAAYWRARARVSLWRPGR